MFNPSLTFAKKRDEDDFFKNYKKEFYLQENLVYMDGNSLGLLSKKAESAIFKLVDSWKQYAIDGWTKGDMPWFYLSEQIGERVAPFVGAKKEEVVATGSTTSNLHQLLATFYKPTEKKTKILADELNFPSDIYAMKSHLRLHGFDPNDHLIRVKSRDGRTIDEEDIIAAMKDDVALIILPTVLYRSGQLLNIKRLTEEAHNRGIPKIGRAHV